jgi:hypothetical protein
MSSSLFIIDKPHYVVFGSSMHRQLAPTMGHVGSCVIFLARPFSFIKGQIATNRVLIISKSGFVLNSGFRASPAPITHAYIMAMGCINVFVG